ncbi:F-box domain [Arabidopsis thaliana x Arabidopsis arenosa]|uniref:F-box domain n=1 Tax=Arabidopsis thaliana x Arabidopsis arenosa TaxID=1240361 RepID=A0A8T2C7D3_9BRAS|nr:F-box domain [Arabidopsis thaliana x Arabidopsis arenosa]
MLKRDRSSVVGSKRHGSSVVLKRHRSSVVELLPHDVVELILEKLPVKPLLRLKSVSKRWKSTIESHRFKERQFICRKQSRGIDVLFVSLGDDETRGMRIVLGSSIVSTVRFPTSCTVFCHGSCDGLLCLYSLNDPSFVVNPATRWHQSFPLSSYQELIFDRLKIKGALDITCAKLGFGRDKVRGTYKPVWLYNSSEYGLENITTCEVFDFSTNAWRYLLQASLYRIRGDHYPVYLEGSLYWFTECEETKVLSFDLHTETFQVISKTPFPHVRDPEDFNMCILDNRLCISEKNWPTQVIWLFDSSGGMDPWKKLCSIDLTETISLYGKAVFRLFPIAILDKTKLLLHSRSYLQPAVIYDLQTKSYGVLFTPTTRGSSAFYSQSLFSALSN